MGEVELKVEEAEVKVTMWADYEDVQVQVWKKGLPKNMNPR